MIVIIEQDNIKAVTVNTAQETQLAPCQYSISLHAQTTQIN